MFLKIKQKNICLSSSVLSTLRLFLLYKQSNHDNSRFFWNVFIYIYLSYKVYSVIVMVNKRQYLLRLWATPGGLLISALACS
jgi:hypothetical protein